MIRLVPGNAVMVTIAMCRKNPMKGEWIYGITWKHVHFNNSLHFIVGTFCFHFKISFSSLLKIGFLIVTWLCCCHYCCWCCFFLLLLFLSLFSCLLLLLIITVTFAISVTITFVVVIVVVDVYVYVILMFSILLLLLNLLRVKFIVKSVDKWYKFYRCLFYS